MSEQHNRLKRQTSRRQSLRGAGRRRIRSSSCEHRMSENDINITHKTRARTNSASKCNDIKLCTKSHRNKDSYTKSNRDHNHSHCQEKKKFHHRGGKHQKQHNTHSTKHELDGHKFATKRDRRARYSIQKSQKTSQVQAFITSSDKKSSKDECKDNTLSYKNLTPTTWRRIIRSRSGSDGQEGAPKRQLSFGAYLHGVDGINDQGLYGNTTTGSHNADFESYKCRHHQSLRRFGARTA